MIPYTVGVYGFGDSIPLTVTILPQEVAAVKQ